MNKASELPINTFIQTPNGIEWRRKNGYYVEIYPHCVDCATAVFDSLEAPVPDVAPEIMSETTDVYFTKFKVLALPLAVSAKLAYNVAAQSYGMVPDHERILNIFVEEVRREDEIEHQAL